jgi:GT2 family glycosyltransferase
MKECLHHTSANAPSVSVIVPAHRDDESFRLCLKGISETVPPPKEVILVDDGAGDSIRRLAVELGWRWLENTGGRGPARARNRGAADAGSDLLFFVDSDVVIAKDAIAQVQRIFCREPDLAAAIGSYDDEPAAPNFLSQYRNLFHHYIHQNSNDDASTFWGACGVIRRDIFQKLGGFNEKYPRPSIEDIEFGNRIKESGHAIRLVKTFQCKHLKQYGMLSLLKSDLLDRALPWTELILRNRTMVNDLNLRISSRLSVVLVFIIMGLLIAGLWRMESAALALVFLAAALAINFPVYRFFYLKRGLWFMIRAIPWHCIYYLCCGLGFAFGLFRILLIGALAFLGRMFTRKKIACLKKSLY